MRIGKTSPAFNQALGGAQNEAERKKSKEGAEVMAKRKSNWKCGAVSFVVQDANQWAEWGVDYLKYDWNPIDVPNTAAMRDALRATNRDIVYSLSNSAPFDQAAEWAKLANSWRTTGDINDSWKSMSGIGFAQDKWAPFQGPGHYNDPDMLVVGRVGWGSPHPTRLTADEQYTHVSLWALLDAPLLLGADLESLDAFTLGLITNDEVIDVNQDPLCRQGIKVAGTTMAPIYARTLEDGSLAVGLFNRGEAPADVTVKWSDLGLSGACTVRDLWRQQELATNAAGYSAQVPTHGVVLVKVSPVK
jgi:alpha-galactosidase